MALLKVIAREGAVDRKKMDPIGRLSTKAGRAVVEGLGQASLVSANRPRGNQVPANRLQANKLRASLPLARLIADRATNLAGARAQKRWIARPTSRISPFYHHLFTNDETRAKKLPSTTLKEDKRS